MTTEIRNKVREQLTAALAPWGIAPEAVYLNGIHTPEDPIVIESATVTDTVYNWVREKDTPEITEEPVWGFFSVPYSFAQENRVNGPATKEWQDIVTEIVSNFI
ncbi:hypothetical protein D3C80_1631010 [compost metagenome]